MLSAPPGCGTTAEPTAETRYSTPIISRVARLPSASVGQLPKMAPITVPQRAMDMISRPCCRSLRPHSAWMGLSAPEMTAVSKPNRNPASATVMDHCTMRDM